MFRPNGANQRATGKHELKVVIATDFIGYSAKKLPSGLKLDKTTGTITGAAKKPTSADGVTVTFTKAGEETRVAQFVVGPIPLLNVAVEGDVAKCKVTGGNKAYLAGKKVSLSAKPPKGTAFIGWFRDGKPWPDVNTYLNARQKLVMPAENLNLAARFKAEVVSIFCDVSAGCMVKESVSLPVSVECESGIKSVSAKKLPSGLKYNKNTGCIEGAAKKAGMYTFALTVTTKTGSKVTQNFDLNVVDVAALPMWAVGSYSGTAKNWCENCNEGPDECGPWYLQMQISISASGEVSGRMEDGGDYGILKNGVVVSVSEDHVVLRADMWWYEDRRISSKAVGEIVVYPSGILEYYDNDDPSGDECCPIQAMLTMGR